MFPLAERAGSWPNISCPPAWWRSLSESHSWNCTQGAAGKYDTLTPSTAHTANVFASHPGWRIAAYKSWAKSNLSVKWGGGNQERGKQEIKMLDEMPPSLTRVSQSFNQERTQWKRSNSGIESVVRPPALAHPILMIYIYIYTHIYIYMYICVCEYVCGIINFIGYSWFTMMCWFLLYNKVNPKLLF